MSCRLLISLAVLALAAPGPAFAAAPGSAAAAAQGDDARYALAGGCFALRSQSLGRLVAKDGSGGYRASAGPVGEAEPFRMKATALGRYMLYGRQGDFLAGGSGDRVETAVRPSASSDWQVDVADGAFRVSLPAARKVLSAAGGGVLVLKDAAGAGGAALFTFERAQGCAEFPEIETSATGTPFTGPTPYGEVRGYLDAHMHMMAFEFLGGRVHCGRPWHPYGVTQAMVDCPDHEPGGGGAVGENVLSYGTPARTHDTVGWPTFRDWPHHASLTHEQSYYKWLERAWMGGQRVFVNLLVDNAVLCEVYPYKQNSCNEMDGVRLQARRINELQDYIDAQEGGPGKGWFRIVRDPFEARRVINQGKLAVVLGIEISKLFDCGVYNDQPECDSAQIDRQLEEVYRLGVRDMELVNKFDNALAGVAGDEAQTGTVVNNGNKIETGKYWEMQTCTGHAHPDTHDRNQTTAPGTGRDALAGNLLQAFLPAGAAPVYPEPPHCNARGLSSLGEHLINRMIAKRMIIDPDHLSVLARNETLALAEAKDYSGVVSSHTWSTPDAFPRIYALGGVVTPYAGSSTEFVEEWRKTAPLRSDRHYFGFGYGADMNGFGAQGGPRRNAANPVRYPFKSFDGGVTLNRQKSGQRVFDLNVDGVAHYGLYPDWIEDLRMIAGDQIVADMARGAESYLQMWERAEGIPARECRSARGRFRRRGLARVHLLDTPRQLLQRAGQPRARGRAWRYCVQGDRNRRTELVAVFDGREKVGLVASTALGHRALHVDRGARAGRLRGRTKAFGRGVRVRSVGGGARYVFGIRRGRVRYMAVASRSVAKTPARLRSYLRLAGLR